MGLHDRLSQIETAWSILLDAHGDCVQRAARARAWLVEHYGQVALRYLTALTRNEETAADLFQEFARGVLDGLLHNVHPEKGRFRNYLKTCLVNLVNQHRAKEARRRMQLFDSGFDPEDSQLPGSASDQAWEADWRQELIRRSFDALKREGEQEKKKRHLYTVLKLRLEEPSWSSDLMAVALARSVGKPVTAVWVRKRLQLARQRLGQMLMEEVAHSLETPTLDNISEELADLGLLKYCEPYLATARAHVKMPPAGLEPAPHRF